MSQHPFALRNLQVLPIFPDPAKIQFVSRFAMIVILLNKKKFDILPLDIGNYKCSITFTETNGGHPSTVG